MLDYRSVLVLCQMIGLTSLTCCFTYGGAKGQNPGPSAPKMKYPNCPGVFSLRRSGSRGWNGKANDISRGYNRSFTFIRPFMEGITPFITFVTSRDAHLVCNSQPQNPVLLRIPRLPGRNRLKWWISPCYKEPTTPKLFSLNFCLATTPLLGYVKTFIEISLRPLALKGFVGERYLMQLFSQQPQTTVDGRNPASQLVWLFILWFIRFYASLSSLVVQNFFHQQYFWMMALIPALDHLVRLNFENAWEATTVLTAFFSTDVNTCSQTSHNFWTKHAQQQTIQNTI